MNLTVCTVVILLGCIFEDVLSQTQGPPGIKGQKGQRGRRGKRGNAGVEGSIGSDGDVGPIGPQGPAGIKGVRGDEGIPGVPAIPGVPGDDGLAGIQGPAGSKGTAGEQGVKGDQGDGVDGNDGAQGPPGNDGTPGSDGTPGNDGAAGSNGRDGARGPPGTCPTPVRAAFACELSGSFTPSPGTTTHIPLTECSLPSPHFNLTASEFTAPVAGIYFFHFSAISDADRLDTYLYINGQRKHRSVVQDDGDESIWQTAGNDLVVQLSPGDVVDMRVLVWPSGSILNCGTPCTVFTGFLLYEV